MGIRTECYTIYTVLFCSGDEDGKSVDSFASCCPLI